MTSLFVFQLNIYCAIFNVPYNPALSSRMSGDQTLTTSTSHDPLLQSSMCTLHATLFAAILPQKYLIMQ